MPRRRRPHLGIRVSVAREGGFILVAVLLLIALATVLIVTTSGFSRIESKAVANSMLVEKARQNALYGLGVALAQLQKEAGPDQRVTAMAEILNTNSLVPSPVGNPFWTGVWKTYNPDWEKDNARNPWSRFQPHDITMQGQSTIPLRTWSTNATNVSWLVSMPASGSGDQVIDPLAWTNWTPSNSVLLASNWGTNPLANTVYAPLVTLTNTCTVGGVQRTNVGAYAYWVSDEGVKAKVSLCDTNATSATASSPGLLVSKLLHFTAPAAPSVAQLLTNYGITGVPDLRGNTNLPKLTTINGLQFVTNGIPAFSNNLLSADLTVHGYGVLCDVRRGGLKQDLTAAFESTVDSPDGFNALLLRSGTQDGTTATDNAQMAWRCATMSLPINMGISTGLTQVPGGQTDGMRWQSLYNYYTLYKSRWPASPLVTNARSTAPLGVGTPKTSGFGTIDSRVQVWSPSYGTNFLYGALVPVVVCQSIRVMLESTSDYHPRIAYYPMLALYNPYSVALNVTGAFNLGKNLGSSLGVQTLAWGTTNVTWPTTNAGSAFSNIVTPPSGLPSSLQMAVTNGPNSPMAPGEIRVYGLLGSYNMGMSTNSNALVGMGHYVTGLGVGQNLQSSASFTMAGGQNCAYCDLGNPTNAAFWQGSPGGTYNVTYASPQPLIAYNWTKYTPTVQSATIPYTINTFPGSQRPSIGIGDNLMPGGLVGWNGPNVRYSNAVTPGSIGNLVTGFGPGVLLASITERLKSTLPARFKKSYLGVSQPMPVFMGNSMYFNGPRSGAGTRDNGPKWGTETDIALSESQPFQMCKNAVVPNATTMSWGVYPVGDEPPNSGNNNRNNVVKVLRGIPFAPLTSLGQFMHAEDYYDRGWPVGQNYLFQRSIPAMSVGGGFCCPETGPYTLAIHFSSTYSNGSQTFVYADNSFMANEALFDTYFFSTVPPTNGFSWGSGLSGYGPYAQQLTTNAIAARDPLPNPRHVFYFKNGTNPAVADLQDEGKAAANLLVDGAFNVNSTSVVAWKALITSLNGSSMVVKNVVNGNTENRTGLTNPIPRFWDVGTYAPNIPWDGTRCLTDLQAETLAREIVRQVKARGPFLSMGDFINRRIPQLNTPWNTNHITSALQSAIENTATNGTAADVNNIVHDPSVSVLTAPGISMSWLADRSVPQTNASVLPYINQIATNTAVGIPGYLMQQDLLQAFAPVMSVRSDTFVIRFYGDSRGALRPGVQPAPESRVWGEAVVQRLPEYYDQQDPILTSTSVIPGLNRPLGDAVPFLTQKGEVLGEINKAFGRRFKVVSLRWLSPDEVSPAPLNKSAAL
jgi:hypothetical protein